jgi:hypothetical protein
MPAGINSTVNSAESGNQQKVESASSINELLQAFSTASVDDQREMAALLALAGYNSGGAVDLNQLNQYVQTANLPDVAAGYQNLLKDAASRYANGQKITPAELLQQAIKYRLQSAGIKWDGRLNFSTSNGTFNFGKDSLWQNGALSINGGSTVGGPTDGSTKSVTQTSINRDIMDPEDAKGLTRAMLQQELGRDPTEAEYEDFIAMLQQAQRANPTKSTTTTNYRYDSSQGGYVSTGSNTTTQDGISSQGLQELAQEKAEQNPDWAEWQAVGTYAPALFDALGATVSGVGS